MMRQALARMKDTRILRHLGTALLLLACRCSLFLNVDGLDDGGAGEAGVDATSDTGGSPAAGDDGTVAEAADDSSPDLPSDEGQVLDGAGDDGTVDAPPANAEAGVFDAPIGTAAADGPSDAAPDTASSQAADAQVDGPADAGMPDGPALGGETGAPDATPDSADFTVTGLLAYYPFDETGGTTSADASGNGHTAVMQGATFSPGIEGNAATMSGSMQYVILPPGIVSGLTSFSISAWCYLNDTSMSTRIFDFGSGMTTYMFLTPETVRFAITTSGFSGEQDIPQNILGPAVPHTTWTHVVVTLAGTTGTLYFNGAAQPVNSAMTLTPASLGTTSADWIGRSQYTADPYLDGKIDNFRIYSRALNASEVMALYAMKL